MHKRRLTRCIASLEGPSGWREGRFRFVLDTHEKIGGYRSRTKDGMNTRDGRTAAE